MSITPFQYNSANTNINIDNAVASILSNFDTDYIINVVEDSLEMKFRPYSQPMPNIVYSYEQYFRQYLDAFESNVDEIRTVRERTYLEIIEIICKHYSIQFVAIDQDYYTTAYYLYEVFVSRFTNNLIKFYTNYIIKEKDFIYDNFNLGDTKKNKDSAVLYSKKIFSDTKLALIHANIDEVIDRIQGFDISLPVFYDMNYEDKSIVAYLMSVTRDIGDLYNTHLVKYAIDPHTRPDLITSIKLYFQEVAADKKFDPNIPM